MGDVNHCGILIIVLACSVSKQRDNSKGEAVVRLEQFEHVHVILCDQEEFDLEFRRNPPAMFIRLAGQQLLRQKIQAIKKQEESSSFDDSKNRKQKLSLHRDPDPRRGD